MGVIIKFWLGLYPLGRSFWGFYIFGAVCLLLLSLLLGAPFLTRPVLDTVAQKIVWPYWALAAVGVWRSASLYAGDISIAPIAAKCFVLLVIGNFLYLLFNGGALPFGR